VGGGAPAGGVRTLSGSFPLRLGTVLCCTGCGAAFVSDEKQERMPSPEHVTIIALAEEGGDAA